MSVAAACWTSYALRLGLKKVVVDFGIGDDASVYRVLRCSRRSIIRIFQRRCCIRCMGWIAFGILTNESFICVNAARELKMSDDVNESDDNSGLSTW